MSNIAGEVTHKYLSKPTTWEYRHIYVRAAGFWQRVFLNLTTFECSHRRDAITYTRDIFKNKCIRPHHVTWKISNIYFEKKTSFDIAKKKNPITVEQGCMALICNGDWYITLRLARENMSSLADTLWLIHQRKRFLNKLLPFGKFLFLIIIWQTFRNAVYLAPRPLNIICGLILWFVF